MSTSRSVYLILGGVLFVIQACAVDEPEIEVAELSQALVIPNGVKLNGVKLNGVNLNGVKLNGVNLNGVNLNGVNLNGTLLHGVLSSDGSELSGEGFVGTDMEVVLEDGSESVVRVQHMQESTEIPGFHYYLVEYNNGTDWVNICDVNSWAVPFEGTWNEYGDHIIDGTSFSFACQGTAVAKCAEWGYHLWETATECLNGVECKEQPLADFHQACTRMVRADYCGDGVPHTENGTAIDIWDALDIMTETPDSDLQAEAEWGVDGARCIRKTRWREIGGNQAFGYIMANCPERWVGNSSYDPCFESESDFHTENGYYWPTWMRSILRNTSGDNVR